MKGLNSFRTNGWVVLVSLAVASSVFASQYTEIKDDAFDGVNDASYVDHVLTWSSDDLAPVNPAYNVLTLIEDTGVVDGYTGNTCLELASTFQDFNSTLQGPARAFFSGGYLKLTFDYTLDGTTITSHELSGPVTVGSLRVTGVSTDPANVYSMLTGVFQWVPTVKNLPSSNYWPADQNSTAVTLSFAIGADLSAMMTDSAAWDQNLSTATGVRFDTQFSLVPEERPIPEPATMLLLGLGAFAVLRRRS